MNEERSRSVENNKGKDSQKSAAALKQGEQIGQRDLIEGNAHDAGSLNHAADSGAKDTEHIQGTQGLRGSAGDAGGKIHSHKGFGNNHAADYTDYIGNAGNPGNTGSQGVELANSSAGSRDGEPQRERTGDSVHKKLG
jgi:hypothetical protein